MQTLALSDEQNSAEKRGRKVVLIGTAVRPQANAFQNSKVQDIKKL